MYDKLLTDDMFVKRLKTKLYASKSLMLDGKLEGASVFRETCKIICNILSLTYDDDNDESSSNEFFMEKLQLFEKFCTFLEIPQVFLILLKQTIDKTNVILKEVG